MWAPAAGYGVFLYELVPSYDPFMWCLCETFFLVRTFLNGFCFYFLRKKIKFVTSTTTAVQSKSNSHVNVYYQPVEFTSFCLLCSNTVRCFVFEEEKVLP
jgi:hypothetical protein